MTIWHLCKTVMAMLQYANISVMNIKNTQQCKVQTRICLDVMVVHKSSKDILDNKFYVMTMVICYCTMI